MELAILVGLPASGKTSFVRARLAATHAHVSKDLLSHVRDRETRQRELVAAALRAGRSVVVDNINATRAERAPLIALAREHGARVVGYYFETTTQEAVARNRGRTGRPRVPDVAIYVAAKRLERPLPAEGLDAVFRVRLAGDEAFEVTGEPPAGGR